MIYTLVVAGSFLIPFVVGLVIGSGTWRQLMLAAPGVVLWLGVAVWVQNDCEADWEAAGCALGAVFLGALAMVWLVGVGTAALVRDERKRPGRRTAAAVGVGLVLVGAAYVVERAAQPDTPAECRRIEFSPGCRFR